MSKKEELPAVVVDGKGRKTVTFYVARCNADVTENELDIQVYGRTFDHKDGTQLRLRKGEYMGIYGLGGFEKARFYPNPKKILTTFRQTSMDHFKTSQYFDIVPITVTEPPEIIDVSVVDVETLTETKKLAHG